MTRGKKTARTSLFFSLLIVLCLTIAMGLRAFWAFTAGFTSDEGWWTIGAKNMLLHRTVTLARWETLSQSPVSTALFYLWQWAAGIGVAKVRILMLVLALWQLVAFYLLVKRWEGCSVAVFALLLVGLQFPLVIRSACVYLEPVAMSLSLLALLLAASEKRWLLAAAGVFLGLTLGTKVTEAWAVAVSLIFACLQAGADHRKRWTNVRLLLIACIITGLAVYGFAYIMSPGNFSLTWRTYLFENVGRSGLATWRGLLINLWSLIKQILPFGAAFAALIYMSQSRALRRTFDTRDLKRLLIPTLWLGAFFLISFPFSALRLWRLYAVYWPLSWLAAKGTILFREHAPLKRHFREHLAAVYMAALVLWSSALTARQYWLSPKTFADDIAVVKWGNVHVKPGEKAVASARFGAGFQFVVYDLRDVADEQDWVLPSEAIKGDPLISWFFVDNGEWLTWADRRRYADILRCDLAREAVQVTVLPGVQVWRRLTTK